jgi:3-oxoadipate enol-lactonase
VEQRVIEGAPGVRISSRLSGDPSAPPVVLLHALGDRGEDWRAVESRLAAQLRVVNVDLRGHGDSDWPGAYSFEFMRDDVIAVLDALDLRDVILIGHSMGGAVAYLVAVQQPDRIARLIVEDVPPPFPRTRALPERPEGVLPFDWSAVAAITEQVNDPTRRWWTRLPDITARTLLIGGGASSPIPQDLLVEVAQLVPDCTLITIDAGHNVHEAEPDSFSDAVLAWLTSTGIGPPASDSLT